jgi:phospho-N-acetylmuramoyl-pentapeptide-transferase
MVLHHLQAAMAIILSLVISMIFGKRLIAFLHRKQIGETVRDLGLAGEQQKRGTPTMGGLIIIGAILIPTLLFARIHNVYIVLMIVSTIWLGLVGFLDDYIKVFKKNKEGLAGRFKIAGQIGLGIIIGSVMYWNENVVTSRKSQVRIRRSSIARNTLPLRPNPERMRTARPACMCRCKVPSRQFHLRRVTS